MADEGDVDAQCRVGFYYYSPTPSPYFYKQSFKYFKKAADKGNTQAQLKVASFYEEGWGAVDQDIDKALEYAKMASNVTYYNSLLLLKKNSVYKESFEVDKKLAEKGDVDALYRVGYCYLNYFLNMKYFNDIRKYDVSIKYLEKAAEKGHIEATYNLAKAHREKYRSISSPLALSYAKKAADKGHAGAMFLLGEYYKNRGINELNGDYHKIAYEYFEKAADLGDLDATKALLFISKYKQDKPDKAFKYYKILADLGDTLAQYEVGMFYTENSYKDYNEAFRYLKMSADKGNTKAQRKVAWMYEFGHGVEKDHAKAFEYYKKTGQISNYVLLTLCAKGEINDDASLEYCKKVFFDFKNDYMHSHINYPSLPYRLAMCYIHGVGVAKDYNKALEYLDEANALAYPDTYTPAQHAKTPLSKLHKELKINFLEKKDLAEKGNADAQYEVAILYEYGRGVDLDFDKAVEYYEKAMENGNLDAIYALAKLYEEKKQEYPKAVEYYEKAMENGNLDAIYQVSRFYAEGKGIQKNEQKAVECYEKLADSGNMSVLYKLGDYYSEGRIVPKDEDKAFECYRKYILYYRKISKNNMNYDAVYRTAYCDIEGKGVKKDELYTIHAYGKIEHIAKSGYLQAIKLLEIDIKKQNNYREEVSEFREKVSELTREEIKKRFIKNKEKYSLFYSQQ